MKRCSKFLTVGIMHLKAHNVKSFQQIGLCKTKSNNINGWQVWGKFEAVIQCWCEFKTA